MKRVRTDYLEAMKKKVDSLEQELFPPEVKEHSIEELEPDEMDALDTKSWEEYMKEQEIEWKKRNERYRGYKNY